MAFGSGFLQGLQVGQQYKHNQILMDQRQEDRDREQYGRDMESLINDWQNTKGDRTDEEFVNSPEFASLAKRHRESKVFEKAMQAGNAPGRNTKLRDIMQDPKSGKNVIIVDTYDDEGRLISKGRPVTEGRTSREEDPKGRVAMFSNQDLYEGMLGAIQQSPDYVDKRGLADRFEASISAGDQLSGLGGSSATASSPAATSTAPPSPSTGADAPAADTSAVATPVQEDPSAPSEALPETPPTVDDIQAEVEGLEGRYNVLRAELDELEDIDAKRSGSMSRQQYIQHRRLLASKSNELGEIQGSLDDLTGSSTARRMGASLSEVPGDFVDAVGEFGEAIADIPAVKGVTNAVSDFFGGLTSGEGTPPPKGTKSSERFEHGADSQANAARKDKAGGFDPENIKTGTRAQQNKIAEVNQATALAVANQQKLTRKQLTDYRKALRAQVLHGDVTVAQATTSYYALLAATKSDDKYKMSVDSTNGVVHIINEADGSYSRSHYATTDSAENFGKYDDKEYKRQESIAKYIGRGDENRTADAMALISRSRDSLNLAMRQPGTQALMESAFNMREFAVQNETSAWGLQWLGTSKAEAEANNPSLTSFISGQVLGIPGTPEGVEELMQFGQDLAYSGDVTSLTEQQWHRVGIMAEALSQERAITKEEAMKVIKEDQAALSFVIRGPGRGSE